jgi:hypothetical protein
MVKLNAHFDGKVIVPDEPLALKPNQKLRISIEPIENESNPTDFSQWIGMARIPNQHPYDPTEEDSLWEKGTLPPPTSNGQS